jgi:long-chain acyl-CoA synthetase
VEVPRGSLNELFDAAVARCGDKPALFFYSRPVSYNELADAVKHLSAALTALGVGAGDRVALHLPNCPQYVEAFFAALRCGAAVVQVSPLLAPPEIDWCLVRTRAKVLVTLDLLLPQVTAGRAQRKLAGTLVCSMGSYLRPLERLVDNLLHLRERFGLYRNLEGAWQSFEGALSFAGDPPRVKLDPATAEAVLQPTGGTTGRQKFAVLTHRNLAVNVAQLSAHARFRGPAEVVLAAPPFTHAYGLTVGLLCALLNGGATAILPRFKPDLALRTMEHRKVTVAPLVPPMAATMVRELKRRRYDLSPLRFAICGGAALTPTLMHEFEAACGLPLLQGYGLSEASPVTHCNPVGGPNVAGSIGVPIPLTEARIALPDDPAREPAPGDVGELFVRGPQVMKGYLGGEDEAGIRDGWLPTGDLAYRDADGWYYLTGRRKDMILTNGLNVYPVEVEDVLRSHPLVSDVAVIADSHPSRGETVKALIVPAEGCTLDAAELSQHCTARLARYKVPRLFEAVMKIPRDSSMRLLRRKLEPTESQAGDGNGHSTPTGGSDGFEADDY